MIAYKGFEKNLSCRGYQFKRYGINETTEANCRQNGFHCAENPLDCLVHYPNWRNSRYFVVKAFGDLDEDDRDTKISCTKMELKEELDFSMLLLRGSSSMTETVKPPKIAGATLSGCPSIFVASSRIS